MFDAAILEERDNLSEFVMLMVIYATVFTIVSVVLSRTIVPFHVGEVNYGGLVAVFLATLSLSYPLTNYLRSRDHEELRRKWKESSMVERHFEELGVYLGAFLATTVGFGITSFLINDGFFSIQSIVLEGIRGDITATGNITMAAAFSKIVVNNLVVFAATFGLSFFISSGMLFIIIWNASVLGVLVGTLSSSIAEIPVRLLPYVVHGSIEVMAYVFAGFAGTLISYHFEHYWVHGNHSKESFQNVLEDSMVLLLLGFLAVVFGAVIETGYPLTLLT